MAKVTMSPPNAVSFCTSTPLGVYQSIGGSTVSVPAEDIQRLEADGWYLGVIPPTNLFGRRRFYSRRIPFGMLYPQLTTFAGYSWHVAMSVPSRFGAVRLIFANTTGNAIPIDSAIVASTNSAANLLVPTGTAPSTVGAGWKTVTFNGANSGTLPANTRPSPTANPLYYFSDWINLESIDRIDGSDRPIIIARVYLSSALTLPAAGTSRTPNPGWNSDVADRGLYASFFKSGDFVSTNQAGFTSPGDPACSPIIGVEYAPDVPHVAVAAFGDSFIGGQDATLTYNSWASRAVTELSTAALPVSFDNMGWGGQTVPSYYLRWQNYLADGFRPSIAIWNASSPNGFMANASQIALVKSYIARFLNDCETYGVYPILVTQCPQNSYDAPTDSLRLQLNNYAKSLVANGVAVIDADAAFSDGGTPARYISGLTTDGANPNEAGNTSLKAVAKPVLQAAIARFARNTP